MENHKTKPKTLFTTWIGYFLLSLIAFWDRWIRISTHYGMPDLDMDGTLWYNWYETEMAINDSLNAVNNLYAYPFGFDFTYLPFRNWVTEFISVYLQTFGNDWNGLTFITNLIGLGSYSISGLLVFLLTMRFGIAALPSFIAGTVFAFSYDYQLMIRGVMTLGLIPMIPLYFYCLTRFLQDPNIKSILTVSLVFSILLGVDAYYAFFSILCTPFFVFGILGKEVLRHYKYLLLLPLIAGITAFFFNIEFLIENFKILEPDAGKELGRAVDKNFHIYMIGLKNYFFPSNNSLLLGKLGLGGGSLFQWTALILGTLSFLLKKDQLRLRIFLLLMMGTCVVLSAKTPGFDGLNAFYFEYFGAFRSVGRFTIFAVLGLSLLAGFGFHFLYQKIRLQKIQVGAFIAIVACLVSEGISLDKTRYKYFSLEQFEEVYEDAMTAFQSKGGVMNLPHFYPGASMEQISRLNQVFHKNPIFWHPDSLSETWTKAEEFYTPKNPQFHDYLISRKLNKVVLRNTFIINAKGKQVLEEYRRILDENPNFKKLGTFKHPKFKQQGFKPSSIAEASLDFDVYEHLKTSELLALDKRAKVYSPNSKLRFEHLAANHFVINAEDAAEIKTLFLTMPFSRKWQMYTIENSYDPDGCTEAKSFSNTFTDFESREKFDFPDTSSCEGWFISLKAVLSKIMLLFHAPIDFSKEKHLFIAGDFYNQWDLSEAKLANTPVEIHLVFNTWKYEWVGTIFRWFFGLLIICTFFLESFKQD